MELVKRQTSSPLTNKTAANDQTKRQKTGSVKDLFMRGSIDGLFLVFVLALLTIGVLMMFSASYVNAKYSAKSNYDPLYYLKRQVIFAVVGIVAMLVISRINYRILFKVARIFCVVSIALLILVLIMPQELDSKEDFKRWLELPGLPAFQPSEIGKFAMILMISWFVEKYKDDIMQNKFSAYMIVFLIIGVFAALIVAENHLSATILVLAIGVAMTYMAGYSRYIYIGLIVVGVAAVALVIYKPSILPGYAEERIVSWLDKDYDPMGSRWQTNQSLNAIGSGGLFGLGIGNSKQKHLYLPEPQNDFIFAIVCEELGLIRTSFVIALFGLLTWRGFVIGMKTKDIFGRMLVFGIVLQVAIQTILNIAVVTDFIPNTGISLPFFSYGGTSLLMLLAEMGVVLSVSRQSKVKKIFKFTRNKNNA